MGHPDEEEEEERRKRTNQKPNKESIRIIQNFGYSYHKESKTIPNRQESRYRIDTNIQNLSYPDEEEEEDANGPHGSNKNKKKMSIRGRGDGCVREEKRKVAADLWNVWILRFP